MEPVIFEAEFRRKKRHKKKIKKKETCTRDLDMELVIFDAALNTP